MIRTSTFLILNLLLLPFTVLADDTITLKYLAQNPTKSKKIQLFENELYQLLQAHAPQGTTIILQAQHLPTSSYRTRLELDEGDKINVMISPTFVDDKYPARIVPVPVLKGLLGYRKLVSRKELKSQLIKVKNINDLRAYSIGQVKGWKDINVYLENDFRVETSVSIDTLFTMLARKRFDVVPLGVIEIDQEFDKYKDLHSNLYVDDSIMLYYPIPLLFHVKKEEPHIARFLQDTMEIIIANGTLDKLVNKHFKDAIQTIQHHSGLLLILKNPAPLNVLEKYQSQLLNPKH